MPNLSAFVRATSLRLGIYKWVRLLQFAIQRQPDRNSDLIFYKQLLNPGDLVFDVGANRGQSAEAFLRAGCQVVSFEPQQDLHREILQICSGYGPLVVDADGLGAVPEQRKLFLTGFDQTASLREDWQGDKVGETTVSISTLDWKIKQYGEPRYCKIDVEGWELEVLSGLTVPLEWISFEFHLGGSELQKTFAVVDKISALADYEFNLRIAATEKFFLDNFLSKKQLLELFPEELGKPLNAEFGDLFCRRVPAHQART